MPIRVFLVDDHALVRQGLRSLLAKDQDILVIGEANNGLTAVRDSLILRPDVIIMDISMREWPQATSGTVALSGAQLSMLLEGIDWRRPVKTWRPEVAA